MLPNHPAAAPHAYNKIQAPVNIPPKNCTTQGERRYDEIPDGGTRQIFDP